MENNSTSVATQSELETAHPHVKHDTHIKSPKIDELTIAKIAELRHVLSDEELYIEYKSWVTDEMLQRFLIARKYVVKDSHDLLISALKWRMNRIPSKGIVELCDEVEWLRKISHEGETGKIYIADDVDKYGRPIVIMDNHSQNTTCVASQQTYLAWNLDLACLLMPKHVDKYVAWFFLDKFSIFNSPSIASSHETLFMLSSCYPERLGHMIFFMPTFLLHTSYAALKYLLDPKTLSKIVFISGDTSDGSENDKLLREIIGDNWKLIVSVNSTVRGKVARGYDHSVYWPKTLKKLEALKNMANINDDVNIKVVDDLEGVNFVS